MMDFMITTHVHLSGARLSLLGHWGNIPFDSVELAELEAKRIAGPLGCKIEKKLGLARPAGGPR